MGGGSRGRCRALPGRQHGCGWAEQRVDTGVSSLLIATIPLWIALFDRIATGQRLTRLGGLGLAVGFVGAALRAGPTGAGHIDLAGATVRLLAAAAWAAGSLYSRRAPLPRRPLVSSSMQMLTGGALLAVVAAASGELGRVHHVSATSGLALVYLIVFGSLLAFTCYAWLLRNARTSLVAGALILAGVALIVSPPKERAGEAAVAVPARGS